MPQESSLFFLTAHRPEIGLSRAMVSCTDAIRGVGSRTDIEHGLQAGIGENSNAYSPLRLGRGRLRQCLEELSRRRLNSGNNRIECRIASFGLLLWADLPEHYLVPRLRARFLVLEAVLTIVFLAKMPSQTGCTTARRAKRRRTSAHVVIEFPRRITMSDRCSHGTFTRFSLQSSHLSICYYI